MTTKKAIKDLSSTLNEQVKSVSRILNDNSQKQTSLLEHRAKLNSLSASEDDIKAWLHEMIENESDTYQKNHANNIKKLTDGTPKGFGELRNIFKSLTESPGFVFNGDTFGGGDGVADMNFLVFMLKQPILDNLDSIVDQITPSETMPLDEKEKALAKVDSDLEKLEAEENELLESLKNDGLIDINITYDEVHQNEVVQPPPAIDSSTLEETTSAKITQADIQGGGINKW